MYSLCHLVPAGRPETMELVVLGDPHYGSAGQDRRLIHRCIKYAMETDNAYLITVGDNLDLSIAGKHGAIGDTMSVNEALDLFRSDFRDIATAGKFLGTVPGNHDKRVTKATGSVCDLVEQTINEWNDAYNLNIVYGDPGMILDFRVGKSCFVGYVTHGSGGGGTAGASVNANEKSLNVLNDADFYLQGHFHRVNFSGGDRIFYDRIKRKIGYQFQQMFTAGHCLKYEGYPREFRLKYVRPSALILRFEASPETNHKKPKRITHEWIYGEPE